MFIGHVVVGVMYLLLNPLHPNISEHILHKLQ